MTRKSLVIVLDAVATGLAVCALVVAGSGGFVLRLSILRVSAQSPVRALVLLSGVLLLRLLIDRHTGPLGAPGTVWRRRLLLPTGTEFFRTHAAPGSGRRAVIASLWLALALGVLLHEQILNPYAVPDHGDPLFSIWRMGWVIHALFTSPAQLFHANIFHPVPLALTLSDPIVLPALLGAPLRAVGVHPVLVYNVLVVSAFWVSGIATYLLAERLSGSPRAAFLAGLIYATYSYRFDHYSHLELQITYWMPFGLLALHMLISTGRWPHAFALALVGVAQLYSGMYYAVFFLIYAVVIGGGLVVVQRPSLRRLAWPLAGAALVAGGLALPMVRAFAAAEPMKGERPVVEIRSFSATAADYVRVGVRSAVWSRRLPAAAPELALFPGAAPLVLSAISLAPPLGALRLVYAAGLFTAVDGSFGLNGLLYPHLYRWLSPVRSLRSPARFGAIVGLTLAILSGFGLHRLLKRCPSRALAHVVFGASIAVVLIDAWPALNLTDVWREPPPIYETIAGRPDVVLAELPVRDDPGFNAVFMYFSLWHWAPMVNGYSGFIPASYVAVSPELQEFPLGTSVAALQRLGVTHVTLNCGLRFVGLDDCDTIADRMRQTSELRLVRETQWEGARVALYELEAGQ